MSGRQKARASDGILIILEGGPGSLPRLTTLPAGPIPDRVTIDHWGRHQHFENTGTSQRVGDQDVPVFRWIYTTAVAE